MSSSHRQPRRNITVAVLAVLLVACGQKVSLDRFNRLRVGQTYDEVREIVGAPASCDEILGLRNCAWGNQERSIRVSFLAGRVVMLSAHNLQ